MLIRSLRHQGAPLRAILLATLTASALAAPPALADSDHEVGLPDAAEQIRITQRVLGKASKPSPDGLHRIATRVGKLETHGPDIHSYNGSEPGFRPGDPERAPACATDQYQRVIYAHPLGQRPADVATKIAEIRSIMRRMNYVLNVDSIASGGPSADYKVLCDGSGRIRVDTIAIVNLHVAKIIDSVTSILGLVNRQADNTIFLDAPNKGWCGIGTFHRDESPGAGNRNNTGGGYAVIERGCWNTPAPMHENAHNQGAVQYGAPGSTGLGAHCAVDYDVMCYSPDGGDLRQGGTTLKCRDRYHFDCGYDTYFNSGPKPGPYLSNHWNLGSRENRFIRFSERTGTAPKPPRGSPRVGPLKVSITSKTKRKVRTRTRVRKVGFRFRSNDRAARFRCRVDRQRFKRCGSPKKVRLRTGWHRFGVRAVDSAGNRTAVKWATVDVVRKRRGR